MREILFRGKRLDNGEWIQGDLVQFLPHGIVRIVTQEPPYKDAEVDSDTVGQFTGLTDKNGRKIFEGDILSIAQKGNGIGDYFYPPLKYPSNAIVKWDKCSWMWEIIAEQRYYLTFPDAWCHFECKIIGNIHDNPELLGGESDG